MADDPDVAMGKLRAQFPQYNAISDAQLAQGVVAKYPQYGQVLGKFLPSQGSATPPPSASASPDISGAMSGGAAGGAQGDTTAVPSRSDIDAFRLKFFNDQGNNIPAQTAKALAGNPNDPAVNAHIAQMQPVSQAAIREYAGEIAAENKRTQDYIHSFDNGLSPQRMAEALHGTGLSVNPIQSQAYAAQDVPGFNPTAAFKGPEGARQGKMTGHGAIDPSLNVLADFAGFSATPEGAAFGEAMGVIGSLGAKAARAATAGAVAFGEADAANRLKAGDKQGAATSALLGVLPLGIHAIAGKVGDIAGRAEGKAALNGMDATQVNPTGRFAPDTPYQIPEINRPTVNPPAPVVSEPTAPLPVASENQTSSASGTTPPNARGAEIYKQQIAEAINQAREIGRHDIADAYQKQLDDLNSKPTIQGEVNVPQAESHSEPHNGTPRQTKQSSTGAEGIPAATVNSDLPAAEAGKPVQQRPTGGPTVPGNSDTAPVSVRDAPPADGIRAANDTKYAGNFNLDRMDTPQDVKDFLTDYVKQNADTNQEARGSVSLAETKAAAAEMGLTPDQLKAVVPGQGAAEINALRNLHLQKLEDFKSASDAYSADSSDANLQSMTKAKMEYQILSDTMAGRTAEAGRTLSSLRILADADAAKDPISQQVEQVMKPVRQGRTPSPIDPTSDTFGATNKIFTQDRYEAAKQRILDSTKGGKKLSANIDPTGGKFDNVDLSDLLEVGGHLLEGGLRKFTDWSAGMAKALGEGLTDAQLQHTWANLRAEVSSRVTRQVQSSVFVDQLASKLHSRQAASDFVDHIGTETLHKLLTGEARTPVEEAKVLDAYKQFQRTPPKAGKAAVQGAMADVLKIVEENRNAQKEARKVGARVPTDKSGVQATNGTEKTPKAPPTSQQTLDASLRSRVGKEGLEATKAAIGSSILGKIKAGDPLSLAEKRIVGDAIAANRVKPTNSPTEISQRLSDAVKETHGQIAAEAVPDVVKDKPKDVAIRMLLSDERANAERIQKKMAGVGHNDTASIARILREESHIPVGQKLTNYWKAGLLSSPRTIAKVLLSHGISLVGDELSAIPSSIMDSLIAQKTGQRSMSGISMKQAGQAAFRAATQGVKESAMILRHGEDPAHIQIIGRSTHDAFELPQTNSSIGQAYIDTVTRAHSASYRTARLYAFARAVSAEANLRAIQEGLTGEAKAARVKELTSTPPADIAANAAYAAERAVYLNDNALTSATRNARHSLPPAARPVLDFLFPFQKVASNIALKYYQSIPGPELVRGIIGAVGESNRGEFDVAAQKRLVDTVGKQVTGAGLLTLGAVLASKGLLTGYGEHGKRKDGKPEGAIKMGGRYYQVKDLAPVGPLLAVGASIFEHPKNTAKAILKGAEENPIARTAETITSLQEGTTAAVGRLAGSVIPQGIADLAAQIDSQKRKKKTVGDYVKERVPVLRQKLKGTGKPETNKLFDPTNSIKARR